MSAKAICEYDGKAILSKYFSKVCRETDPPTERVAADSRVLQVKADTDIETACSTAPWINTQVRLIIYMRIILQAIEKHLSETPFPQCLCTGKVDKYNIIFVEAGGKAGSADKTKGKAGLSEGGCWYC